MRFSTIPIYGIHIRNTFSTKASNRGMKITVGVGLSALVVGILIGFLVIPSLDTSKSDVQAADTSDVKPTMVIEDLSLTEIFEMTEAGVVQLVVKRNTVIEEGYNNLGSGFVFDKMGHIITNAHVVSDANSTEVTFLDGRAFEAEIVGADDHTDLAVVRVDADPDVLHPLPIGDSGALKVGESVAAIGNPFGLSGSMTSGIVSQISRQIPADTGFSIPDIIQTDAAINPGNSGGPLLNMRGEVIGVNTSIQSNIGEFVGVGFAVPSQTVAKIVPTLISDGKYDHPWIGVSGQDINPDLVEILNLNDTRGFLVLTVEEDSPADRAGILPSNRTVMHEGLNYTVGGDIVMKVDDIDVRKVSDILIHLQRSKSVGDEMLIQVLRNDLIAELTLILDKRPEIANLPEPP